MGFWHVVFGFRSLDWNGYLDFYLKISGVILQPAGINRASAIKVLREVTLMKIFDVSKLYFFILFAALLFNSAFVIAQSTVKATLESEGPLAVEGYDILTH